MTGPHNDGVEGVASGPGAAVRPYRGSANRVPSVPKAKRKPKWFVYVLRCGDGTLYTGVTTDPDRRLAQHNAGTASKYTRSRRPVAMAYREPAKSHGAALRREVAIKKLSRSAKEELIAAVKPRESA